MQTIDSKQCLLSPEMLERLRAGATLALESKPIERSADSPPILPSDLELNLPVPERPLVEEAGPPSPGGHGWPRPPG